MDPFEKALVGQYRDLRAFAIKLTGKIDSAEDCVQTTMLKALAGRNSFKEGTNLRAWLMTILRNTYFSLYRKRRREVPDPDGAYAATLATKPDQEYHVDAMKALNALSTLHADHREVVQLVTIDGESYEHAAAIAGIQVGTVKSRLNRARMKIISQLETPDRPILAVRRKTPQRARDTRLLRETVHMSPAVPLLYGERFVLERRMEIVNPTLLRVQVQIFRLA